MEISTKIEPGKRMRRHKVSGAVVVSELQQYLKTLYGSPDFDAHMHVLWDLQEADVSSVTSDDVRGLMEYVGSNWGSGGRAKAALVVSADLEFGMSRMYQLMMESVSSNKISIFKDMDAAVDWIGEEDT